MGRHTTKGRAPLHFLAPDSDSKPGWSVLRKHLSFLFMGCGIHDTCGSQKSALQPGSNRSVPLCGGRRTDRQDHVLLETL